MDTMAHNGLTRAAVVAERVRQVLPEIADGADDIERNGRVSAHILKRLEEAGAFRASVPLSLGGEGMSIGEVAGLIDEVAAADASTAWHLMVAAGTQLITSRLPKASLRIFYANGPDTWAKAAASPKVVGIPVDGGYRLSGRWPLASGAREFDWISLGFFIRAEKGIRILPNGVPDMRVCLVPRGNVRVIETWDSVGLRGTRSDDLEVDDLFVPEGWQGPFMGPSQLEEPEYIVGMPFCTGPHHCAVVTGVLRAAIADLAAESLTRKPSFAPNSLMKDDAVFRTRFGEIAAGAEAVEAMARRCIAILENCAAERRNVTPLEGGRLLAMESLIHHQATGLMDQILMLSGSGAVYSKHRQQRRWRDMRCVAQHVAANIGNYSIYADALIAEAAKVRAPAAGQVH
jgi:alkylation response protein AidB-like acyl-CoA dehydrogenase